MTNEERIAKAEEVARIIGSDANVKAWEEEAKKRRAAWRRNPTSYRLQRSYASALDSLFDAREAAARFEGEAR